MATSKDCFQTILTMHKEALLGHRKQKSEDTSTLLGGQLPNKVVHDNNYIPLMTTGPDVSEKQMQENPQSFQHAILTALPEDGHQLKPVIVVGPAGVGRTTALEKLIVDWATGKHLQHFSCVFHFTFRDLNAHKGVLSLQALLLQCYSHLSPESLALVLQNPKSLLFLFDGLDQYQHSLDPPTSLTICSDPHQPVSVSMLVASLVHGPLLKGAAILLTSRPTAASLESLDGYCVELLGFLKPQRKAYCDRFFSNPIVASQAFENIERTMGFYDFCTSPRFCWTTCSIYKSLMEAGESLPETLTQVFVYITVHLIRALSLDTTNARDLVTSLGRMASHCCLGPDSNCSKEEMASTGVQQFLTTPTSLKDFLHVDGDLESDYCIFSFHTQKIQEFFLAASFYLDESEAVSVEEMLENHEGCVEFLDLYLAGLSEPSQRKPLESELGEFNTDHIMDFSSWFKSTSRKALESYHTDRHLHYFHLLHQRQNEKLVKEIITPSARGISYGVLGVHDCVSLSYIVTCLGEWDQLNLYNSKDLTEEKANLLVPAIRLSRKIILVQSSLSAGALAHLASALSQGRTTELDMSYTPMGDTGFKVLCTGLGDCNIQTLKLPVCGLTEACCGDLVAVLTSEKSHLRVLELRGNAFHDQGLRKLSHALGSPHCKLQELQLPRCELTGGSMEALSTALCVGQSELRILNLEQNCLTDQGVDWLAKALQYPCCQLQSLILFDNELTAACCAGVAEALQSEGCRLTELDLSVNELGQEGALQLCKALNKPGRPLEKLRLVRCELTPLVFKELGVLLSSGTSGLRTLSVGLNNIGDEGAKHLWVALGDKRCSLEHLDVEMIQLTDACVGDLSVAVRASGSLKSLVLKNNHLTDTSVPALVKVMQDSRTMQEMNLQYNNFSEDMFEMMDQCAKIKY
ncbi:NACHT, LRR and PYD domains-containing protein 3 [Salmo salar]|uniref:NACHT, LRR and PYD domains-containing protein 3 n=1 Tax=Salmo salar TaxID=8030 RepID=A0A1S3LIL8_SALSA|nr:NACHT, LRR and PYD domains-containing protein 3 [Salmo salar]|eukprot:XP_013990378.1 PREDICTED: NACHT, LRR and PYD domains-containing protein 3-like isoform X2 [Salmo salar]